MNENTFKFSTESNKLIIKRSEVSNEISYLSNQIQKITELIPKEGTVTNYSIPI